MDKAEANGKTDLQVNIFQTQKGGRLSGIDLIWAGEGDSDQAGGVVGANAEETGFGCSSFPQPASASATDKTKFETRKGGQIMSLEILQ